MSQAEIVVDISILNRFTIEELGTSGAPLTASALDRPCAMYADHGSARPAMTQGHHIYPVYLQNRKYGQLRDGSLIFLCGTCHDNTHAWLYWLLGERREPAAPVPARAKAQAQIAFDWYNAP